MKEDLVRYKNILMVIRHAESDPETGKLTKNGEMQSKLLGPLVNHTIHELGVPTKKTQLLTGPAERLVETADIVAKFINVKATVLPRLALASATRHLTNPSPEYDDDKTNREVLFAVNPATLLLIIIAHNEMMGNLGLVHVKGGLINDNFPNTTGYTIDQNGRYKILR